MVETELLTPAQADGYRDFLARDARNLIYASIEYRDFLAAAVSGEPLYLVVRNGDRIIGALPCFRTTQPGMGTIVNSLPWYGSHGGCTLAPDAPAHVRRALLDGYLALANGADVLSATLIMTPFEHPHLDAYRERLRPAATDARIGQITELPPREGDIGAGLERTIAQKTRNLVRKSLNQGFTFDTADTDANWRFLYDTHVENMAAVGGTTKLREHFTALRRHIPAAQRSLAVARSGDEPVAALLLLYFNRTVEYFTPVIRHAYRSSQPLSFLIWHAMLDAVRRGFRWWNWGGTWASQKSLHHFKAGWGARDFPYTYLVNTSARGVAALRESRAALSAIFPGYYTYPYALLDHDTAG